MVICLERSGNDLHMVQLMPLPPHHLCFSKIQNGLSFWYRPTQVVLEKRPLNDCVCISTVLQLQSFYDPLSGTTQVSQYQKDKPFSIVLKQT